MGRRKGDAASLPDGKTADASKRKAATATVERSARGSVLLANGRFVTRRDKSLEKLDKI